MCQHNSKCIEFVVSKILDNICVVMLGDRSTIYNLVTYN